MYRKAERIPSLVFLLERRKEVVYVFRKKRTGREEMESVSILRVHLEQTGKVPG